MNIILDVQGQIFKTDYETITKIPYFKNGFDFGSIPKEIIIINRPSHIFKHILALACDPFYKFPAKYASELDFYDIDRTNIKLYNKNQDILDELYYLKNKCPHAKCKTVVGEEKTFCDIHRVCEWHTCVLAPQSKNLKFCANHSGFNRICHVINCHDAITQSYFCNRHA